MLVQDVTGQLYEAPDDAYGLAGNTLYDGLGNPVGFPPLLPILGSLAPIAAKVLPSILPSIIGGLTSGLNGADDGLYGYYGQDPDPYGMGYGLGGPGLSEEVVYDGFGNPVGIASLIAPIASAASRLIPQAARAILPAATGAIRGALTSPAQIASQLARTAAPFARAIASGLTPPVPGVPGPGMPGVPGVPPHLWPALRAQMARARALRWRRPPPGWIRPPVPYTGLRPSRLYMRCLSWPGPGGLVPASAAQAMPGAPGSGRSRYRRRRRRSRGRGRRRR